MNTLKIALFVLLLLLLFLDLEITYASEKFTYKIKYNGVVWVALDYFTLWLYESDETPMKWFVFTRISK